MKEFFMIGGSSADGKVWCLTRDGTAKVTFMAGELPVSVALAELAHQVSAMEQMKKGREKAQKAQKVSEGEK